MNFFSDSAEKLPPKKIAKTRQRKTPGQKKQKEEFNHTKEHGKWTVVKNSEGLLCLVAGTKSLTNITHGISIFFFHVI